MIGVVDIGNTRTKMAIFESNGALKKEGVVSSKENFLPSAVNFFSESLDRAIIGSVVPDNTPIWADLLVGRAGILHVAGHDSPWGFRLGVERPEALGVDRLANLEGALGFPGSVMVVHAGTATKFDLLEGVGESRSFPGGAIAPGVMLGYEAMLASTAQLRPVDLGKYSPVVGFNTESAIRSGVVHGFAAMVDGMVSRIFEERGIPAPFSVVATGGNSELLKSRARFVTHYKPRLTLEGLRDLAKKI